MKFSNFPRKCYSILLRFLTTQKCSIVTIATTGCCHQPISCCCQSNEQHIVNQAENHFHHFFAASHSSQNSIQSTLSICKFQAKKSAVLLSKRFLLLTSFLYLFICTAIHLWLRKSIDRNYIKTLLFTIEISCVTRDLRSHSQSERDLAKSEEQLLCKQCRRYNCFFFTFQPFCLATSIRKLH